MIKVKQIRDLAETVQKAENNAKRYSDENFERKYSKNSAFNKSFGIGPDTVSEGDHVHSDIDLRFNKLEKKLNLSDSINHSNNPVFTEITPSSSLWSRTSSKVPSGTIKIEEGRFEFSTSTPDEGLTTSTLTDLIPRVQGKKVVIVANVNSENTTVYIKMRTSAGWSFARIEDVNSKIAEVSVPSALTDFKLAVENKASSENKCSVTNLKLYLKNEQTISSNADIPNRNYSIWSWNKDEILNPVNTVNFLKKYNINRVYQWFDLKNLSYANIRNFTKNLQENNITVNWLTGDPSWCLKANHYKLMDTIRKVNDYNMNITNGYEKIGTIQIDLEPHTLEEWKTDEASVIEQYQTIVKQAYEECLKTGLSLVMCTPIWLDSKTYNNSHGSGNVFEFITQHSSATVLMAYNVKSYVSLSQNEIIIGSKNNKRVAIGFETKPPGEHGVTDDITYYGKPLYDLYSSFETLYLLFGACGNYNKYEFAIHDYVAFKNYIEGFSLNIVQPLSDGPLVSNENIALVANKNLSGTAKAELVSGNNKLTVTSEGSNQTNDTLVYNEYKVYHEGHKPTAAELQVLPLSSIAIGSGTFNSLSGVTINIGKTMKTTTYRVSVTPTSNPDGNLGEYWVTNKTTTSFQVFCSGSTTTTTFDWTVLF